MKNTKKAFLAIGNCKLNKNTNVLLFTNRFQTCKQIGVGNIFSTPHSFQFSFQLTQKRTHFSFNYTPKNKIQVRKSPLPHLPPFNQTLTFAFTPGHIYLGIRDIKISDAYKEHHTFSAILLVIFLIVCLILYQSLDTVYFTGRKRLIFMSKSLEYYVGHSSYTEFYQNSKQFMLPDDSNLTEAVRAIGNRIVEYSGISEIQTGNWEYHVIRNDEVQNAFVLPGGKVFVYTGIFNTIEGDPDQLAVILSHEIGHVVARHGAEGISFSQLLFMISAVCKLIFMGAPLTDLSYINSFLEPTHSRMVESEADYIGLILLKKAGFKLDAAWKLWEKMDASSVQVGQLTAYLATHPSPKNRSQQIKAWIESGMLDKYV